MEWAYKPAISNQKAPGKFLFTRGFHFMRY